MPEQPFAPSRYTDNATEREQSVRRIGDLKAYRVAKKQRSVCSDRYFDFMQRSEALLQSLSSNDAAIADNQRAIRNHEITVLEAYPTREAAESHKKWFIKKRQPTSKVGWLNVRSKFL
jgi:hypothetical protein